MFSWAQPEYVAYLSDSSWLLRSWGKDSSVRFCTEWCLTRGLQDTRWVHLPEKKNTRTSQIEVTHHTCTHINISMVMRITTTTTLAFQARYCPKTLKLSCCNLWARFSFETARVEDHARARASLSFASLALLSDFLTRAPTIGDKIS